MQSKTPFLPTALAIALAIFVAPLTRAQPQGQEALQSTVQKAVQSNPEVTARYNAYRAAADAVDAARGGYYPRLDLSASAGHDRDRITGRAPVDQSLSRNGVALSLRQLLWDGLATRKAVSRLEHERLARYFELLETTEQTALEAARAYYDVLRFRRMVALAEDNYVQHRAAFNQIQSRFRAGVGRGVDLEQAGARLALAESNLTTEMANLHDVSARYQRIVGEAPPNDMPLPPAFAQVPGNAVAAGDEAVRRSAAISAAIETLRGARAAAAAAESAYQPTVEARLRSGGGRNFDGVRDQRRDSSAEIVLNWNLFNGGADAARVRQQANLVNQAADLRDKTCRDVRQTVAIAYNDTRKLVDQITLLDRNTLAIEKARDAYRQQFDIGQRSLLDLLNAENELYTARRSYANAEYDLAVAYVRTQAATGQFSQRMGLTRGDTPDEVAGWSAGGDAPGRCPSGAIDMPVIDTTALAARAAAMAPNANANPVAPSTPTVSTPLPAAKPPVAATPATLSVRRLQDWIAAWESRDVNRYMAFYAPSFRSDKGSTERWKAERRRLVGKRGPIRVQAQNIQTRTLDANTVEVRFVQAYRSDDYNDDTEKVLTWAQIGGEWFIVKESNR